MSQIHQLKINNEYGKAIIEYGNFSIINSLKQLGYDNFEELGFSEKQEVINFAKTLPQSQIKLIDWHSNNKGNGFGRAVINKIFDIAEQLNVNSFTISLPSFEAQQILKHYVEIGVLKPIENSKRGISTNEYHTSFELIKRPLKQDLKQTLNEMPAINKNQLNFFKLVQAYKKNGEIGFYKTWKELYPKSKFPNDEYLNKVVSTASRINDSDLIDLTSGIKGDEVLGDKRDIKAGYWILFKTWYKKNINDLEPSITTLIAQITRVDNSNNMVKFAVDGLYNKNGVKILPLYRSRIVDAENKYVDFTYFDNIIKTSKNMNDLKINNTLTENVIRKEFQKSLFKNL